jgi:hypothetical protein
LGLAEFNSATDNEESTEFIYLKASNYDWTVRANVCITSPDFQVFSTGNQSNSDGPSGNLEICYNLFIDLTAGTTGALSTRANAAAFNLADTSEWWYRNTVLGVMNVWFIPGNGPYVYENNAVQYGTNYTGGLYYIDPNGSGNWINTQPFPNGVTNSGTGCQAASGVLDLTTYELTGTYRTKYLGARGAEVY